MNKEQLKMFVRILASGEGEDFLKFLNDMSNKNYEAWKKSSPDMNDVCKGKALAIDEIISCFTSAQQKLNKFGEVPKDWM